MLAEGGQTGGAGFDEDPVLDLDVGLAVEGVRVLELVRWRSQWRHRHVLGTTAPAAPDATLHV